MEEENKWRNKSFLKAAKHSIDGIIFFIKTGRNIKLQILAALLVVIAAITSTDALIEVMQSIVDIVELGKEYN